MSDFTYNVPALPTPNGLNGEQKSFNTSSNQQIGSGNTFPFDNFSHQSSFSSSGSGSAAGGSFSSVDALPAISRDFARPTSSETRRPATAGGALHPTRAFGGFGQGMIQESSDEHDDSQDSSPFNDPTRRASESTLQWPMHNHAPMPMTNNFGQQVQREMARVAFQQSRPQTSDGLPHHAMTAALPSIPSINHIDSSVFFRPSNDMGMSTFPGNPSYSLSSVRPSYLNGNNNTTDAGSSSQPQDSKQNFVSMTGAAHKKRPRRTFDQIERLYNCGWNGCDKSYGTLNHLNAHVATQKHGVKRLPSEFKDMRKSHKKKKKEMAAAAANAQYAHHVQQAGNPYAVPWTRASVTSSSGSDERRDSNTSYMNSDYSGRSSIYSAYGMSDSRPSTAGSMASSVEVGVGLAGPGPASAAYASAMPQWGYGDFTNGAGRRASAPTHIPMPQSAVENGFRQIEGDFPTPTPQNPFPQMNANGLRQYHGTLSGTMANTQQLNPAFDQQFAFQR